MIESKYLVPISRQKITDVILQRIINLISDEGLRPGDRLPTEHELMARFSVGRSSLREAAHVLSALGVVGVNVGEGMFVGNGDSSALTLPLSGDCS
jgi:GntR family transcriptional repressor for pyruvate dehydrogenase complex